MSAHTRRDFLATAGTGLAAGLLLKATPRAQRGPTALRVRKNVMSAAAAGDLTSLKKGVTAMRKLVVTNPSDPRGWILQAFIHGDCTHFTKCQHGNWFFPPWHRSLLYYFEQLIQHYSGDANFALPYWDWSRTHSVPGSFYGAGNPLDDILSIKSTCPSAPTAGRGRTATDAFSASDLNTYVGPVVISNILKNPDYATFGGGSPGTGQLEGTPHNFIHRWVGGTKFSNMVQYFSPLDPIFWLHHCNIDRLYSNWLSRPKHFPPPDTAWKNKSFNDFFDRDGHPAGSAFKCGDTVDSRVMGYVYDSIPNLGTVTLTVQQQPSAAPQVVGTLTGSAPKSQAGVLTFVTDAPPSNDVNGLMNAAVLGVADYFVRLRIEGVKTPPLQNTAVHVFLGPGITTSTPTTAPGYAGSFTFFDGPEGGASTGDHQHGSRDVLLNVSDAMTRLYGDINVPQGAGLAVSIVTRPLYTGVTAFSTIEQVKPDRVRLDVVQFPS